MPYFINNLNQKIAYKYYRGKSPGIIFIHGLSSDMEGSKALHIEKYAKSNKINFIKFDCRGHGKSFGKFEKSNLQFSLLKNYYFKNILCFGDVLHKIHPLAGQGFNMTLRDIKIFNKIIKKNLNLGLPIGENVLDDFQGQTRHLNFTFATFVD